MENADRLQSNTYSEIFFTKLLKSAKLKSVLGNQNECLLVFFWFIYG